MLEKLIAFFNPTSPEKDPDQPPRVSDLYKDKVTIMGWPDAAVTLPSYTNNTILPAARLTIPAMPTSSGYSGSWTTAKDDQFMRIVPFAAGAMMLFYILTRRA